MIRPFLKHTARISAALAALACAQVHAQSLDVTKLNALSTSQASVVASFKSFNRQTKESLYELALTNVSGVALHGPLYVTVGEVSVAGVTVKNATGVTTTGVPYLLMSQNDLAAGVAVTQNLVFANPQNVRFTFTSVGYSTPQAQHTALQVQITHPGSPITVGSTPLAIDGTVNDPSATVTVNGAAVDASSGSFHTNVALSEGHNVVIARAVNTAGEEATATISASLDLTPPYITVESPSEGAVLTSAVVNVSGLINDIVRGTVSEGQANVTVNGHTASVANRSYLAQDIPLQEGPNTIHVEASDAVGNTSTKDVHVVYEVPTKAFIDVAGGQGQQAQIRQTLPQSLQVKLLSATGQPVAGKPVVFRVSQGDGVVGVGGSDEGTAVLVTSDANGLAGTKYRLGGRAGSGTQRVTAKAVGFEGEVVFVASATPKPGNKLSVNSGNNQRAAANQPLPLPFIVVVTDEGSNVIEGAQVQFAVTAGGGSFENGARTITATTDSDGRASARLTLGSELGLDVQRVTATVVSNTSLTAGFTASALQSGPPGATSISGVVLDNQDHPLPQVSVRVEGTTREAQTDDQGHFHITEAPVGPVHLIADGSTTSVPGEWPTLSYNIVTVAGADNPLPAPVYLVKLDTAHAVTVGVEDKEVTLPEVPGFKLTVKAGSVTFPNGDKVGQLSVTPVNVSKIPMAPPNGMQPQFIVTIQPTGARFDPPAPLQLPNVDGHPPGAQVEMYSFDHDLDEFVAIGLGTVSADGTVIASNPGIGVIKAGWHCGSPPDGSGCTASCGACQILDTASCSCEAGPDGPSLLSARRLRAAATGSPAPPGSSDTPHDCKTPVCQGGGVVQVPDPLDGPDPNPGDCKRQDCNGNTINDDADTPTDACKACADGSSVDIEIHGVHATIDGLAEKWKIIDVSTNTPGAATFAFTGTAASDKCKTLKYDWTFGDGSTGTGAQIAHTYSAPGEFTVTLSVTCTGCPARAQTASVKAVALAVTHETFAETPANTNRTKLGVAEDVTLRTSPSKSIDWQTTDGHFDGGSLTKTGPSAFFTAPSVARTPHIRVQKLPMLDPVEVASFTVVQPFTIRMEPFAIGVIEAGTMGASLAAKINIEPSDVSFYNIQIRESSGNATAVKDFFKQFPADQPPPKGLFHVASPDWSNVSQQNVVVLSDNTTVAPDHIAIVGYGSRPWGDGSFQYLIPWRYRTADDPTERDIKTLLATFDLIGGSGQVTIRKGGVCVTRKADETASRVCAP